MKKWIQAMLLVVLTFVFIQVEQAEASFRTVKSVNVNQLDVKAAASPSAQTTAQLKKGEFVTVYATTNGWASIESKGVKGFVAAASLATPTSTSKIASSKSGLVVKGKPTLATTTNATLLYNMIVEDYGSVGDGWSFVQYGNVTGYVKTNFIGVPKTTKKYAASDLVVRNIASPSGAQVATVKATTEVTIHSTLAGWSYISVGTTKGYVVAAQLTDKKPATSSAPTTGLGFFKGLVPQNVKKPLNYDASSSFGMDGSRLNTVKYSGSQKAGSYNLVISYNGELDESYIERYSETTAAFSHTGYGTSGVQVNVNYPVKVGNTKSYTAAVTEMDEDGELYKVTKAYTSRVVAANTTYTIPTQYSYVGGTKVPNAVVIEVTGKTGEKLLAVYQLNKGLVFSEYTKYEEEFEEEIFIIKRLLNE